MSAIFLEREEHFSVYRRPDGSLLYLAHGAGWHELFELSRQMLASTWQEYGWQPNPDAYSVVQDLFLNHLRSKVIEPDDVDVEVVWCERCEAPYLRDDCFSVEGGEGYACEDCIGCYYSCESCEERFTDTTTTLAGNEVCDSCRDEHYWFCDDCDGYYHHNADHAPHEADDEEGEDDDSCGCESPAPMFRVRNDGDEPLANDTRATVTLPAGVIDSEGMARIESYLRDEGLYDAANLVEQVGVQWQIKQGNFTKRLSRLVFTTLGQKLLPPILSQIGCIAREHSTSVDFNVEVTRNLNLSARQFGHVESCWWGGYSYSRCTLKSNGGFGLRTFDDAGDVNGRAWVMPLVSGPDGLTPTFETETPEAFIVFNGYKKLTGYTPARLISHMAGWTYRKITFNCYPMYVNPGEPGTGYLVAPEEIASQYDDGHLTLALSKHSSLYDSEKKVLTHV